MALRKCAFVDNLQWLLHGAAACALLLGLAAFPVALSFAQEPDKDKEKSEAEAKPEAKPEEAPAEEPTEEPAARPEGPVDYLTLPYSAKLHKDFLDKSNKDADKEEKAEAKKLQDEMRRMIDAIQKDERGDLLKDDATAGRFDAYYTRYILAKMTLPEKAVEFAKFRQDFFSKDLAMIKSQAAHDRLVDLTYRTMLEVAKGNYHPVARYNAALMIGELNAKEAVKGGSSPAAPEPLTLPALGALLKELESPTQIDPVRVACLIGILRHAEMDGQKQDLAQRWEPRIKTKVVDTMLALLNVKELPKGRSPEGHLWMQRRAIDVLGAVGDQGVEGIVAKKLESLIADKESTISLRCSAAVALGRINSLASSKIDPGETSQGLAELALLAGQLEIARLEAEKKNREDYLKPFSDDANASKGGGFGPGGAGPGGLGPGGLGPGGPGLGGGGPGGLKPGMPSGGGPGGLKPGMPSGAGSGAGGAGGIKPGGAPGGAGGPIGAGGAGALKPGGAPGGGAPGGLGGAGGPTGAGSASPPRPGGPRGFQGSKSGGGSKTPYGPGSTGSGPKPGAGGKQPSMGGLGGKGGMGGMGGGIMGGNSIGGGGGEDLETAKANLEYREKYKLELSCRRLKYELYCVKQGLEGTPARPKSGLKNQFDRDPYKSYIDKLLSSIDEVTKVVENPKLKLETLLPDLKKKVAELEKLASAAPTVKKPAAAPAESPAEEPDGPDGPAAPAAKPAAEKPAAEKPADEKPATPAASAK